MAEPLFPPEIIAAAQASEKYWWANARVKIPASVTLAQWAIESAYGRSMSGRNNPFGIKATKAQIAAGRATVRSTKEFVNGRWTVQNLPFADYDSLADAFTAHAELLATSKYYVKSRHADSAEQFARDLTGIYATAPNYGDKLISIMRQNNLTQFDASPVSKPATELPLAHEGQDRRAGTVVAGSVVTGAVVAAGHAGFGEHHAWIAPLAAGFLIAGLALAGYVFSLMLKEA